MHYDGKLVCETVVGTGYGRKKQAARDRAASAALTNPRLKSIVWSAAQEAAAGVADQLSPAAAVAATANTTT